MLGPTGRAALAGAGSLLVLRRLEDPLDRRARDGDRLLLGFREVPPGGAQTIECEADAPVVRGAHDAGASAFDTRKCRNSSAKLPCRPEATRRIAS